MRAFEVLVAPAREALVREAGTRIGAQVELSKVPWFGFNGLWVLAVDETSLWTARQTHLPKLGKPRVQRYELSDLRWERTGPKSLRVEGVGAFRSRSVQDLDTFVGELPAQPAAL